MLPFEIFRDWLVKNGYFNILSLTKKFPKKSYRNLLNRLLNLVLFKGYSLKEERREGRAIYEYKGVKILKPKGEEVSDLVLKKGEGISLEGLVEELKKQDYPTFVVDMQFFSILFKKEKLSLLTQLMEGLNVVREYLLDENFVLTNI